MDEKSVIVENKIISATITCIEAYGLSGATNRRIAEKAEVNLAAINYYFRSKEALLKRVMEITLKNAFDLSDMPPMPGAPARERCVQIFVDLVQGGLQYPGITRAHFYNIIAQGEYDALLVSSVHRFIDDLAADLLARGCTLGSDELKPALMQIFSSTTMISLAPRLFEAHSWGDLHDPRTCRAYIERLVDRLLPG